MYVYNIVYLVINNRKFRVFNSDCVILVRYGFAMGKVGSLD